MVAVDFSFRYERDFEGNKKLNTSVYNPNHYDCHLLNNQSKSALLDKFTNNYDLVLDIENVKILNNAKLNSISGETTDAFLLNLQPDKYGLLFLNKTNFNPEGMDYKDAFMAVLNEIVVFDSISWLLRYAVTNNMSYKQGELEEFYGPIKKYLSYKDFGLIINPNTKINLKNNHLSPL